MKRTTAFWNEYSILKGSRVHYRSARKVKMKILVGITPEWDNIRMDSSKRISLLIGVLILATFLRFYHLTTTPPGLFVDEAMDGNNAVEVHETGQFKVFYPEFNGREGLYVNILALLFNVLPSKEPWVIRLPAAVAGVLTVLGIYLLVAELFGDGPALLAAFLLATSFWHIIFSRIGFRAILAPLLLTWSLWLLIKAFKAVSVAKASWGYAVLAGIVYALGFYTYIAYRITPLLFLLFIPFFQKMPGFWKRVVVFVVVTFLVAAPIGWYFVKNPADFFGRMAQVSVTNSSNRLKQIALNTMKTLLMLNVHGDHNWRHNVSGAPELFWPVGVLFVLGTLLSFCYLYDYRRRSKIQWSLFGVIILFGWFVLAVLPAAASNEGIPHALRSILMLPPAIIFAAIGGVWLFRHMKDRWGENIAHSLAFIFLASVAVFAYADYFSIWAGNPNVPGAFNASYVEIGNRINALPPAVPKYVVVGPQGTIARDILMNAETTMYITGSFTTQDQTKKNIHYVLPDNASSIPAQADVFYIK